MRDIIINADDCGKDLVVNQEIGKAIQYGKISSTTIMANMDDFEGAVKLYNDYHDVISFGWHINLTEGSPLTQNQYLLDKGYYKEIDGQVVFNGEVFWRSRLDKEMTTGIKKELKTQYEKIRDNGIEITHADGHHHIHTAPSLLFLIPSLLSELRIERCRHISNYGVSTMSYLARQIWTIPYKVRGLKIPNTFTSFAAYHNNPRMRQGRVIELECHPGHPKDIYKKEMELIYSTDLKGWDAQLVTYKDF